MLLGAQRITDLSMSLQLRVDVEPGTLLLAVFKRGDIHCTWRCGLVSADDHSVHSGSNCHDTIVDQDFGRSHDCG